MPTRLAALALALASCAPEAVTSTTSGDTGVGRGGGGNGGAPKGAGGEGLQGTLDSASASSVATTIGSGGDGVETSANVGGSADGGAPSVSGASTSVASAAEASSSTGGGDCTGAPICVVFSSSGTLCDQDPLRYAYSCVDPPYDDCYEGVQANGNGWPTWCCLSNCVPLVDDGGLFCNCPPEMPMQCTDFDGPPVGCRETGFPNGFCCGA